MNFELAAKVERKLLSKLRLLKKQRDGAVERIAEKARRALEESSDAHANETAMVMQQNQELASLAESLGATEDEVDVEVGE